MPGVLESHTEAILDALRAELPSTVRVGDGEAAGDVPHCAVYQIPGGEPDGSLCDPQSELRFTWQVTSVGRRAAEARWVADLVRGALMGRVLAVTGRSLWSLRLVSTSPATRRDDALPGTDTPLFYCWDRFYTVSNPA